MPSTNSLVVSIVLLSSTVMTPSLPTRAIESAMIEPIDSSLLAAMMATFLRSSFPLTGMLIFLSRSTMSSTAFSMPRFIMTGLTPLTTARNPSLKIASAITVAVVVLVAGDVCWSWKRLP